MLNKISNDFQDFLREKYGEDGYAELLAEWLRWHRRCAEKGEEK